MRKIIANLKPYWKGVLLLFLLLCIQAYSDLSLPAYTQDIIDVGIQNKGIEHILPEKTTEKEYEAAQIFMTDEEREQWEASYTKEDDLYVRTVEDEKTLDELDEALLTPIVLTYQLGHTTEADFKETVQGAMEAQAAEAASSAASSGAVSSGATSNGGAQTAGTTAGSADLSDMSIEEIETLLGMEIETFTAEDENGDEQTYVDMRPIMQSMIEQGAMSDENIEDAKEQMNQTIEAMGSQTLTAMGIAYASDCDQKAGMDIDQIQKDYLWAQGLRMTLMALLMFLAAACAAFIAARIGANVGRDLRGNLFKNVMRFSNAEMEQFSTASLITRSTNDVQQIQNVTTMMLRMVMFAPIMGALGIVKVVQTGAHMGYIIALAVLLIMAFVGMLFAITMPKFKMMQKLVDKLNLVAREILTGLSVIRAFRREETEERRFDEANTNLMKTQLFTNRVMTLMQPTMQLIMYGLVVIVTWVAAQRIDNGELQVGAMTAFITYSMMIVMSFFILTMMSILIPRAGVAAERIHEVVTTESSILEAEDAKSIEDAKGVITFRNVGFHYPGADNEALSDIDFTAEPGKTTAIIGSTGSGKTTLVNLIPRFYDATRGEVLVDGVNVKDLKIHDLREEIGFVPQKGILFSGTIESNIRFGKHDANDEAVKQAAEIAQASDFIEEKEDKYASPISQGGSNVSGGQKQRLAIARALAKEPKILVFDDSFSALDMKTDAKLRHELEEQTKDSTKIIVAQRISTILHADQILVMDEGRIVGKGTHHELMEQCEVYQQIAHSQLSNTELEGI